MRPCCWSINLLLLSGGFWLFLREVEAQYGAGSAIYIPDDTIGTSFAYIHPFTGVRDAGTQEFTIEFWYLLDHGTTTIHPVILSIATEQTDNLFLVGANYIFSFDGNWMEKPDPHELRDWYHVAVAVDKPNKRISWFWNGVLLLEREGNATGALKSLDLHKDWTIVIGNEQDAVLTFSAEAGGAGSMDNLRIWKKALTEAEVQQQMHSPVVPHPDLIAGWTFEEGSGTTSREVVADNPAWHVQFANSYAGPEALKAHDTGRILAGCRTAWTPSGARASGQDKLLSFPLPSSSTVTQPRRRIYTWELAPQGAAITFTSLPTGSFLLQADAATDIAVGTAIPAAEPYNNQSYFYFVPPSDARAGVVLTAFFAVSGVGGTTRIQLHPVAENTFTGIDFGVTLLEDVVTATFFSTHVDTPNLASHGLVFPFMIRVPQLPAKGKLTDFYGVPVPQNGYVIGAYDHAKYQPRADETGKNYTSFRWQVVTDAWFDVPEGHASYTAFLHVTPQNDLPTLQSYSSPVVPAGTATTVPVDAIDVDGDDVVVEIMSLPAHGDLWLADRATGELQKKLTITAAGVKEVEQWAAEVLDFSTHYDGSAPFWVVDNVVGEPLEQASQVYGDSTLAWSPLTPDGGCVDRGTGEVFYTEFVHVRFNHSIYAKELYVYQNLGAGTLVGVRAWDDIRQRWVRLYIGDVTRSIKEGVYTIFGADGFCGSWFRTSQLYLELDTCNRPGYNEIDAIWFIGSNDTNSGYVPPDSSLVYIPDSDFSGNDSFTFVLTDCPGDRFRRSENAQTVLQVQPPEQSRITVGKGEDSDKGTDIELDASRVYYINSLPTKGHLTINEEIAERYQAIQPGDVLRYVTGPQCNALLDAYTDLFYLSEGSRTGRGLAIRFEGCDVPAKFPFWIFGIIGGVIVIAGAAAAWFMTKERRKFNALFNNTKIAEECAEAIATMRLDEVSYLRTLESPNKIQKSFLEIIRTLEEYKSYMPNSILQDESEDDLTVSRGSTSRASTCISETTPSTRVQRVAGGGLAHLSVGQLKKKNVGVASLNLSNFLQRHPSELQAVHTVYMNAVVQAGAATKAIIDNCSGDRVTAHWNAANHRSTFKEASVMFCCMLRDTLDSDSCFNAEKKLVLHAGIGLGCAHVGNMGVQGLKHFAVLEGVISTSKALVALGKCMFADEHTILAPEDIKSALGFAEFAPVTRIKYAKSCPHPFVVFSVVKMKEEENEEWMYILEQNASTVLGLLGRILKGRAELPEMSAVPPQSRLMLTALAADPNWFDTELSGAIANR